MSDLIALRRAAREIFDRALKSVDAGEAVRRAVRLEGSRLRFVNTNVSLSNNRAGVYSVAVGKAARPMASALSEVLGERLTAGVITAPASDTSLPDCWRVFAGGHPLPNGESFNAARAAFELLRRANVEGAPVVFLISGGGSAMMEWPRDGRTTLEELRAMNEALVSCGASIREINCVRRAVSAVKGGGLARLAPDCDQVSLIVSDTNAGDEAAVASGPTFDETDEDMTAADVITRYRLETRLPDSILRAVRSHGRTTPPARARALRQHYVLLDNESALAAAAEAARSSDFAVEVARDVVEQPVAEGCATLLDRLLSRRADAHSGVCLISGGEFACPVRGGGRGGRNTESALRWAIELDALAKSGADLPH
ncbi:MAG TPA: glycerate-2-kinase family protein, partial [Pyrinomonadaceae bacterium]|nr:glycerate-2-kinase family protein [Pyrinomonadaceae bacterium]